MNALRKASLSLVPAVSALVAAPAMAQAAGPDFTALTGAVDFNSTQNAILSVGALVVGLTLVVLGIRKVIGMIGGGR